MKTVVVKIGGRLIPNALRNIAEDLKELKDRFGFIIVHGGADEVTRIARDMGKEQRFVVSESGIRSRYTDKEMAFIYEMVMAGRMNKQVVRAFQSMGVNALGLSGPDGCLIRAKRKEAIKVIEGGKKLILRGDYTGKITEVNVDLLNILMKNGYVPVIAPVATGIEYEPLNVDSDMVASFIAGLIKAESLIFLTDVSGIFLGEELVRKLKGIGEIERYMELTGHGMRRKIMASIEALKAGVPRAIIALGLREKPIKLALDLVDCTVLEA